MNDPVVEQLTALIKTHGRALLSDRGKLDTLLAESTSAYPNKVKALMLLLDKDVVAPMLGLSNDAAGASSLAGLRRNTVNALSQSGGLNEQAASWAFDGWASALGLSTENAAASDLSLSAPMASASTIASPSPSNVYAPPTARVADQQSAPLAEGNFIENARGVDAGRPWPWIVEAWQMFKPNWLIWIVNVVIFVLINMALGFIPLIGQIAGMLIAAPMFAGLMIGCDAIRRGEPLTVNHLFAGFQDRLKPLVIVGLIYGGAIFVIVLVMMAFFGVGALVAFGGGGSDVNFGAGAITMALGVLIMLALMIPIFMAYVYAPALVALNGMDAVPAMKASFFGCLKNIVPGIVWGLIALVLTVIASIPFGLGLFVLMPVMIASIYTSYRDIYFQPQA